MLLNMIKSIKLRLHYLKTDYKGRKPGGGLGGMPLTKFQKEENIRNGQMIR